MQYLITHENLEPFYTNWFMLENNFTEGMVVFDLINGKHCYDGKNWITTEIDHL